MIKTGKCPGCGKVAQSVRLEELDAKTGIFSGPTWRVVSYLCPDTSCSTILGVQMDPVALNSDLVKDLKKAGR